MPSTACFAGCAQAAAVATAIAVMHLTKTLHPPRVGLLGRSGFRDVPDVLHAFARRQIQAARAGRKARPTICAEARAAAVKAKKSPKSRAAGRLVMYRPTTLVCSAVSSTG